MNKIHNLFTATCTFSFHCNFWKVVCLFALIEAWGSVFLHLFERLRLCMIARKQHEKHSISLYLLLIIFVPICEWFVNDSKWGIEEWLPIIKSVITWHNPLKYWVWWTWSNWLDALHTISSIHINTDWFGVMHTAPYFFQRRLLLLNMGLKFFKPSTEYHSM